MSRGQNELIGEFKMVPSDVMDCTYIPTEINRELLWIATRRGKLSGLLEEDRWPIILVDRLLLVSPT